MYLFALVLTSVVWECVETNSSFLDVFLKVYPADDFCGAQRCNISYAISVLQPQNQFDLQSVMLQDGRVARNDRLFFEENTIVRLNKNFEKANQKIYLGIRLFDVPDDIQDYFIIEVTDTIQKKRRTKIEFTSTTVRVMINVYKKKESTLIKEALNLLKFQDTIDKKNNGCACVTKNCGCCEHIVVQKIHLNDNVCVNISYISEDIGMKVAFSVNDHVYYAYEISVRNPPPICFEVPHLREFASLCVRFYKMDLQKKSLTGCLEIEVELYHMRVAHTEFGCFRIPI